MPVTGTRQYGLMAKINLFIYKGKSLLHKWTACMGTVNETEHIVRSISQFCCNLKSYSDSRLFEQIRPLIIIGICNQQKYHDRTRMFLII